MDIDETTLEKIEKEISKLENIGIKFEEILKQLEKRKQQQKSRELPVSIFNNNALSALETIVKFLKEQRNLDYKQIASLLNRNYDPIAITYRKARKKMHQELDDSSKKTIPISIFSNKKLSVLENLTSYLKHSLNKTFHEIAVMLNRDDRTIWTVYNRSLKKNTP